jgi:hypothetical protein
MSTKLTPETIVQRNPKLIANHMDGEIVMMSIDNGEYYGLDEIGSRIWELMGNPIRIDDLINMLTEEFEVQKEECANDTMEFLNDLEEKHLLVLNS